MPTLKFGQISTIFQKINKYEGEISKSILIKAKYLGSLWGSIAFEGDEEKSLYGLSCDIQLHEKSAIGPDTAEKFKTSEGSIDWDEYDDDDDKPYKFFSVDIILDDEIFPDFWGKFSNLDIKKWGDITIDINEDDKKGASRLETIVMERSKMFFIESYAFYFIPQKINDPLEDS